MSEKNGVYQQLRGHLAALKLTTIAETLAPALEQAEQRKPSYTQFLADLLTIEAQATEQRSLGSRLRLAGLDQRSSAG
jgi:DNA replication protein DnaC